MKNTFVKVLSFAMALTMIMGCFAFVAVAAEHTHEYSETVVEATCVSKGHTVYTCECGDYYLGKPTEKAEECRAEDLKDIPASAPTCTEPAYVAHKECVLCGKVYGKVAVEGTKPTGHDYELVITDPECGVDASMIPVCKTCGYEDRDHSFIADENNSCHPCSLAGHSVEDYVYVITLAPTCTEKGKANYVCPVEGCTGGYFNITITAKGHNLSTNTTPATCLEDGSKVTTCSRCDYRFVEVIPALGHDYDLDHVLDGIQNNLKQNDKCVVSYGLPDEERPVEYLQKDATCYQDGYRWVHCVREGCECEDYEDAVASGHLYKMTLPKTEAHVPETVIVGNRVITKYYYTVKNDSTTVYNGLALNANDIDDMIDYLRDNLTGFSVCTDTVNGYTKCIYCGTLTAEASQTHIADGHKFESMAGNGADETVVGNRYIETKGWDIIWDEKPCAADARNYAIRECKECNYQDPNGSYFFVEGHDYHYVCDDANCTTTIQITIKDNTKEETVVTVQNCVDCTHAGRKYVCYGCGAATNAHYDKHNWVVTEEIGVPATCNLPAKYVWVCANHDDCAQTTNQFKSEQIRFWQDTNGNEKYDWSENDDESEVAHWGYDQFLDPTNHEPYDAATGNGVQYVAPRCNQDGSYKGYCTWCSTQVNVVIPKGEEYHKYTVIEAGVVPNCMETGKTATEKCDYCANVKGGELLPRDYDNHVDGCELGDEPIYTRWATCTVTYADAYQYSMCEKVVFLNEGEVNPANHVKYGWTEVFDITATYSTIKTVKGFDPTCETTGLHTYTYCEECDYIISVEAENCKYSNDREWTWDNGVRVERTTCPEWHGFKCAAVHCTLTQHKTLESYSEMVPGGILLELNIRGYYNDGFTITEEMVAEYYATNNKRADVADEFIIAELGHDFWFDADVTKNTDTDDNNILLVYLHETCTAPGNDWKIQCLRCTKIDPEHTGETILPHGVNAEDITYIETSVANTCTEDGVIAGRYCDKCTKEEDPWGQDCLVCRGHSDNSIVPAHGHELVTHKVQNANCLVEGYVFKKCSYGCYSTDVLAWVCEGSDYVAPLGAGNHDYTTNTFAPDCTNEGYDEHYCPNCGDVYTDNVKAALGHKDENGNAVYFCCTGDKYDQYRGSKCAVCNVQLSLVWDGLFQAVEDGLNNPFVEHNYKKVVIDAGCEVDGYWYEECLDCGNIRSAKNADGEWEGIYTDIPATGHDLVDIVDEKCVAATPEQTGVCVWLCGNCGEEQECIIYYTRDVKFSLTVLPYITGKDAAGLSYVNGGYVEVLVKVSTEDLVFSAFEYRLGYNSDILSFVSAEPVFNFGSNTYTADNGDNVSVSGWFAGDKTATFDGLNVVIAKVLFKVAPGVTTIGADDIYTADVQFNNAAEETIDDTIMEDIDTIELALMGDLNDDGRYSMEDVKLLKDLVGGEYNNIADIDNNGIINIRDYGLLVAFVTSNQTIADYYAMFGIDVIALAEAYDYDDYNGDGVITNVDAKMYKDLIAEIGAHNWTEAVSGEFGDFAVVLEAADANLIYAPSPLN